MSDEEFLTPEELVTRYKKKISKRTLANWRSNGEGPKPTKVGGRVLYQMSEIKLWEAKRTTRAA